MRRRNLFIFLASAVLAVTVPVFCAVRDKNLAEGFDKIQRGMTPDQVTSIMGGPDSTHKGCTWEFVHGDADGCAEIYVYASAWAPLKSEYPVIFFNARRVVIDKHIYHPA